MFKKRAPGKHVDERGIFRFRPRRILCAYVATSRARRIELTGNNNNNNNNNYTIRGLDVNNNNNIVAVSQRRRRVRLGHTYRFIMPRIIRFTRESIFNIHLYVLQHTRRTG